MDIGGSGQIWLKRLGIFALALTSIWTARLAYMNAYPQVTFIFLDVGQGKCDLIVAPNGRSLIFDCGSHSFGQEGWGEQIAQKKILPELYRVGIRYLDVVAISHPHEDHCNALPIVINETQPSLFWRPVMESYEPDYLAVEAALKSVGTTVRPVRYGQRLWLDVENGVVATVIGPPVGMLDHLSEVDANDASVVLKVDFGDVSALLTGDIGEMGQRWLLRSGVNVRADILDVPHHGSKYNIPSFLKAVRPQVAIISAGKNNPFNHPDPSVIKTLQQLKATVWHTGEMGTLFIRTEGKRLKIERR